MGMKDIFNSKSGRFLLVVCIGALITTSVSCARSPQAKRDKFLAAGKQQMDKKNYNRAVLEFRNAVKAMPNDAESYYQLGMAFVAAGDARDAYLSLKKAVELNPNHPLAGLRLGQLMASARDPDVVKMGQDQLKKLPGAESNPEILSAMAFAHLKLGETDDAIEALSNALNRSPGQLGSSILLALANLSKGDANAAEEVLKQACASNPGSPDPYIVLGQFYRGRDIGLEPP